MLFVFNFQLWGWRKWLRNKRKQQGEGQIFLYPQRTVQACHYYRLWSSHRTAEFVWLHVLGRCLISISAMSGVVFVWSRLSWTINASKRIDEVVWCVCFVWSAAIPRKCKRLLRHVFSAKARLSISPLIRDCFERLPSLVAVFVGLHCQITRHWLR